MPEHTQPTPAPLSAARVAEMKARLAAATPGPWTALVETFTEDERPWRPEPRTYLWTCVTVPGEDKGVRTQVALCGAAERIADAHLIANAPADLGALLAEVEALRGEVERIAGISRARANDRARLLGGLQMIAGAGCESQRRGGLSCDLSPECETMPCNPCIARHTMNAEVAAYTASTEGNPDAA